jgi:hypothetical protein
MTSSLTCMLMFGSLSSKVTQIEKVILPDSGENFYVICIINRVLLSVRQMCTFEWMNQYLLRFRYLQMF